MDVDKLIRRYDSPLWEQRVLAIVQMRDSDDPRITPLLIKALADPEPEVRSSASMALSSRKDFTIGDLAGALGSQDEGVRAAAVGKLGRFGDEANPLLLDALKDRSPAVRREAAWVLGCIDAGAAISILEKMEGMEAEIAAVKELQEFNARIPDMEKNLRMLAESQRRMRECLEKRHRDDDARTLARNLGITSGSEYRRYIVQLLGERGTGSSAAALVWAMHSRYRRMIGEIADALEDILDRCDDPEELGRFESGLRRCSRKPEGRDADRVECVLSYLEGKVAEKRRVLGAEMDGVLSKARLKPPEKQPKKRTLKR